jgi:hypothetical protein
MTPEEERQFEELQEALRRERERATQLQHSAAHWCSKRRGLLAVIYRRR